jgi:hypothetical protein
MAGTAASLWRRNILESVLTMCDLGGTITYFVNFFETGAGKRKGKLDGGTFAQMMIFGFWQEPAIR